MDKNNIYDAVIIGAGPAGLSAAIYMARARYKTLLLEKEEIGGQIKITDEVVNYPGIIKTDGASLTKSMFQQAQKFGAQYKSGNAVKISLEDNIKIVHLADGEEIKTFGVIIATGANPRKIGFEGEKEFQGHGVAYCATCDGEFFSGLDVFVVGGGFAALEESMFLTKYAKKVTIMVRKDTFNCAKSVVEQVMKNDKINILYNTEIKSVEGDDLLKKIIYYNNKTGEEFTYEAEKGKTFGVFVFAGYVPATNWLENTVHLDNGYIVTDKTMKTDIDGIYAAGDVCIKELRQVVTATSDGAVAATNLEKYIAPLHKEYGIKRETDFLRNNYEEKDTSENKEMQTDPEAFINDDIVRQIKPIIENFENKIVLHVFENNSTLSDSFNSFAKDIKNISDKILIKKVKSENPALGLSRENEEANIFFYSIPGGHEFNSFIIAMHNLGGKGQSISEDMEKTIRTLDKADIKIVTTLSCTKCPTCVMAAQKIASINKNVSASMMVISDYPTLKDKYNVMSVPCVIINDEKVSFGKKDLKEMIELLQDTKN